MSQSMLIVFISSVLAFGSCVEKIAENQTVSEPSAIEQTVPSDTTITLERTACFGSCPVYQLTISADGKVIYEGREHVKKIGKAESRISRESLKELLAAFNEIKYFTLRDNYDGSVCPEAPTDNPSANTSLTMKGKTKTIKHYLGCRGLDAAEKLTKLEDKIDETVNVKQWLQ